MQTLEIKSIKERYQVSTHQLTINATDDGRPFEVVLTNDVTGPVNIGVVAVASIPDTVVAIATAIAANPIADKYYTTTPGGGGPGPVFNITQKIALGEFTMEIVAPTVSTLDITETITQGAQTTPRSFTCGISDSQQIAPLDRLYVESGSAGTSTMFAVLATDGVPTNTLVLASLETNQAPAAGSGFSLKPTETVDPERVMGQFPNIAAGSADLIQTANLLDQDYTVKPTDRTIHLNVAAGTPHTLTFDGGANGQSLKVWVTSATNGGVYAIAGNVSGTVPNLGNPGQYAYFEYEATVGTWYATIGSQSS